MPSLVGSITRAATRSASSPLNILTCPTHERFETGLCLTGHNFYAIRGDKVKDWDLRYAPLPENYNLFDPGLGTHQIPTHLDFDVVLSQNKFGQFGMLKSIAQKLQIPFVSLEHTLPVESWPKPQIKAFQSMRGDVDVFISDFSREKWGWKKNEATVIHHGIDTSLFCPHPDTERQPYCLSVVNDWINRDYFCGYSFWKRATERIPTFVVGDTPGLSVPAKTPRDLAERYQSSLIFVNTSLVSPIPTALLEAMSCGCGVVTTATCMIPDIVKDGVNGFLCNTPEEMNQKIRTLLQKPELAKEMGENARQTVLEYFSMDSFVNNWNKLLGELCH